MIYLDNAATSFLKPKSVAGAVQHAMRHYASVGRGGYAPAMGAARAVYDCRCLAGKFFDCEPEQVVFTFNATHGLNVAIRTLVPPGGRVVISGFEHNAVVRPLHALGAEIVVAGRKLFSPEDTLRDFAEAIRPGARCVICTHVSNVFGYILPVERIAELCRSKGVPFILDASQSAGVLPISLRSLGADFIAMPGHKGLFGPQGTGLLLCGRSPAPLMQGGTGSQSLDRNMPEYLPDRGEAGTQNVAGICGLSAGIRFVHQTGVEKILSHERQFCEILHHHLASADGIKSFYAGGRTQTGVLSLAFPDADCEEVARELGERGCAVRAGLHCAPLAHESADTLTWGTLRLSPSVFTPIAQAKETALLIKKIKL